MIIEQRTRGVEVRAPAKVNLFLEVLGKRPDGYHALATLMVAVSLYDQLALEADASGDVQLDCDHPTLSTGPDNLVVRAARLLQQRTGTKRGARLRLSKRIPLQAGLGGGSSDAAAALAGLNELWQLRLPREELVKLGAELGSDVPFFFGTPAAWCTGRGEIVTPLALGRPLDVVLVCPGVGLSTAAVFRGVEVPAQPLSGTEMCHAVEAGNVQEMGRRLHNRLQAPAERLWPALPGHLARLTAAGPAGAAMSGSGSSLFALARDRRDAVRIARELRCPTHGPPSMGWQMFLVRSCF